MSEIDVYENCFFTKFLPGPVLITFLLQQFFVLLLRKMFVYVPFKIFWNPQKTCLQPLSESFTFLHTPQNTTDGSLW